MKIVVLDYGSGNLRSAERAIARLEGRPTGAKHIPSWSYADALAAWTRRVYGQATSRMRDRS